MPDPELKYWLRIDGRSWTEVCREKYLLVEERLRHESSESIPQGLKQVFTYGRVQGAVTENGLEPGTIDLSTIEILNQIAREMARA